MIKTKWFVYFTVQEDGQVFLGRVQHDHYASQSWCKDPNVNIGNICEYATPSQRFNNNGLISKQSVDK